MEEETIVFYKKAVESDEDSPRSNKFDDKQNSSKTRKTSSSVKSTPRTNPNLKRGHSPQVTDKFKFKRTQGKLIDSRDRHWILRLYHWLKDQPQYQAYSKTKLITLVADCSNVSW